MADVIGVAGCGAMGLPMAQCLARAGFEVWGYDVRPAEEFGDFRERMVKNASDFARRCDVVISVVRDIDQTRALLFGESQGILRCQDYPHLLVISSTVSPRFIRKLETELPSDMILVDAPMSGAPHLARSGELSFMLGGSRGAIARLSPLFETMGQFLFHMGDVSMGMTAKVVNNYCVAASVVATHRALDMASALELNPRRLLEVMKQSSGSNWFADRIDFIDWSGEGYSPNNTIGLIEKDVNSSLDAVTECDGMREFPLDVALLASLRMLKPLKLDEE